MRFANQPCMPPDTHQRALRENALRSKRLGQFCLVIAVISSLCTDTSTLRYTIVLLVFMIPLLLATVACALDGLSSDDAPPARIALMLIVLTLLVLPLGMTFKREQTERPSSTCTQIIRVSPP
ncbi:hypothetical protein [Myxococcus guangdongensis]|uniref:hypothetical protein n=1 Tax=Myxococcus guangdongensis TaxID=2906760 RepID=UPI0020A7FA55|nr:hypothetical protein [Myxococcus guangdongensis]